jgi:hypothetical protein
MREVRPVVGAARSGPSRRAARVVGHKYERVHPRFGVPPATRLLVHRLAVREPEPGSSYVPEDSELQVLQDRQNRTLLSRGQLREKPNRA